MTPLEEIEAAKKAYDQAVAEFGTKAVRLAVDSLFADVPELTSISWTQYTPYFNDGDACEFRVNDPGFKFSSVLIDEDNDEEFEWNLGYRDAWDLGYYENTKPLKEKYGNQLSGLSNILCNTLQQVCYATFGDHVRITINRDSPEFMVDDYDHD